MLNIENSLIILANGLLWFAIVFRSSICEYAAWILWIVFLGIKIKRNRESGGSVVIFGMIVIFLIVYLIYSFMQQVV